MVNWLCLFTFSNSNSIHTLHTEKYVLSWSGHPKTILNSEKLIQGPFKSYKKYFSDQSKLYIQYKIVGNFEFRSP